MTTTMTVAPDKAKSAPEDAIKSSSLDMVGPSARMAARKNERLAQAT